MIQNKSNQNEKVPGRFLSDCAGYEINTLNLPASWEYIYQNNDVLLKVDQFGPVYAQAYPPGDVLLFKRESGQRFSAWTVWISRDGSTPFTNFFRPQVNAVSMNEEPDNLKIIYRPECAQYSFSYDGLEINTEFMIPLHGVEIIMKMTVKNLHPQKVSLRMCPHLVPYNNQAQLAPWDKNEWYLKSGYGLEDQAAFWSQLLSPDGNLSKRRTMVLFTDKLNLNSVDISLETFIGNGSAYCPEYSLQGPLRMDKNTPAKFGEYREENVIYAYPPVFASEYFWCLEPGETKELVQVIGMYRQEADGKMPGYRAVKPSTQWFQSDYYRNKKDEVKECYENLSRRIKVKTKDERFNAYVNGWLPLQMTWIASLDRGWPTGMRGSRDSAQDFAALLFFETEECRKVLLNMLSCQRTDGWFPRQYSASGRSGHHDLRNYVDAGVFVIEFLWKYLSHTGDYAILDELLPWLDSDEKNNILQHIVMAMDYYLEPDNIGEHGLCKIREGDWLDAVNRAGILGRGETVMVTMQAVMALNYLIDILNKKELLPEKISFYEKKISEFTSNIQKHAMNSDGYYNGVFTDAGQWLFSPTDSDGVKRHYGPVNWYSVISGITPPERFDNILRVMDTLKSPYGYRLFFPALGDPPMEKAGRIASGDVPPFMGENGNVYNHGSQGFLARALAAMGKGDLLFDVLTWLFPCYEEKHPLSKTMTPPYAIVNCWQQLPIFDHRGMMCFLTGSVAMAVRGTYEWLFGIKPVLEGLILDPCLPETWQDAEISFTYKNKQIHLCIKRGMVSSLMANGKSIYQKTIPLFSYREAYLISEEDLLADQVNEMTMVLKTQQ